MPPETVGSLQLKVYPTHGSPVTTGFFVTVKAGAVMGPMTLLTEVSV